MNPINMLKNGIKKVGSAIVNPLIKAGLSFVSDILVYVANLASAGNEPAKKGIRLAAQAILAYEDELTLFADRTDNDLDDKIVSEIMEAARELAN